MSAWKMGADLVAGNGLWTAPQVIATILLGPSAYDGGERFRLAPVAVGLGLHELTSAGVGLVYVPLLWHPALGRWPVVTAVVYALTSWAVYQVAIMPWLAPVMKRESSALGLAVAHVVLGVALGLVVTWRAGGRLPRPPILGGDEGRYAAGGRR